MGYDAIGTQELRVVGPMPALEPATRVGGVHAIGDTLCAVGPKTRRITAELDAEWLFSHSRFNHAIFACRPGNEPVTSRVFFHSDERTRERAELRALDVASIACRLIYVSRCDGASRCKRALAGNTGHCVLKE